MKLSIMLILVSPSFLFAQITDAVQSLTIPQKQYQIFIDSFKVLTKVRCAPKFTVTIDSLAKRLPYPQMELDNGISGDIYGRFKVDSGGNIDSVWLGNRIHLGLDNATLRFLKAIPRMIPARRQGKSVSCICQLAFHFRVSNIKR